MTENAAWLSYFVSHFRYWFHFHSQCRGLAGHKVDLQTFVEEHWMSLE